MERHYFSLVCIFKKAIRNFEVKVNVQKGALRFEEKNDIDVLVSFNSHFHPLLSYANSIIMSNHVKVYIRVLGFHKLEVLKVLMRFLEFCALVKTTLMCSYLHFCSCNC